LDAGYYPPFEPKIARFQNDSTTKLALAWGCFVWRGLDLLRLSCTQQEHVPSPASELRIVSVFNLGSILELIAILISALRVFVIQVNYFETKFVQPVQLPSL